MKKKTEGIDHGFIDLMQIDRNGEVHKFSLEWHKGTPRIEVLGTIPNGNEILFTVEALKTLYEKLLAYEEQGD